MKCFSGERELQLNVFCQQNGRTLSKILPLVLKSCIVIFCAFFDPILNCQRSNRPLTRSLDGKDCWRSIRGQLTVWKKSTFAALQLQSWLFNPIMLNWFCFKFSFFSVQCKFENSLPKVQYICMHAYNLTWLIIKNITHSFKKFLCSDNKVLYNFKEIFWLRFENHIYI